MLIDKTFFFGSLVIANINEPEPNNRTNVDLEALIAQSEDEVLSMAFGIEMWNELKQQFVNNNLSEVYRKLIYGETYQKDGKNLYWKGIINEPLKQSFLADYVYAKYHTNNITQQTEFGQVATDVKVGIRASSTPKIIEAWNRFLSAFNGINTVAGYTLEGNPYWFRTNRLGNGSYISYYAGGNGRKVTLLQYLQDKATDFPLLNCDFWNWDFEFKNSFGI